MKSVVWIFAVVAAMASSAARAQNFGGEVNRFLVESSLAADTFTFTGSIPAATRGVVALGWEAPSSMTLSSITDSKGNTWTIHTAKLFNSVHQCAIASADVVNPVAPGDTITIRYTSGVSAARSALIFYIKNVPPGAPIAQNMFNSYGTAVNAPITVPDPGAFVVGILQIEQNATYSNSLGTMIGARVNYGDSATTIGLCNYVFYKDAPISGGTFNPKGLISVDKSYEVMQVAFKLGTRLSPPSNLRIVQ
jgi:hypothetical protein